MIKCPNNHSVPDGIIYCPYCGYHFNHKGRSGWVAFLGIVFVFAIIMIIFGSSKSQKLTTNLSGNSTITGSSSQSIQEPSTTVPVPQSSPTTAIITSPSYVSVPLDSLVNYAMENLTSPLSGELTFNDVPFSFLAGSKSIFHTQDQIYTSLPTIGTLNISVIGAKNVYILINGDYVFKALGGQSIGRVTLFFSDGTGIEVDLVAGENIRENWAFDRVATGEGSQEVITSVSASEGWSNVYQESQVRGSKPATAFIDMITINIPSSKNDLELTKIKIDDTSLASGLWVYAITVSKNEMASLVQQKLPTLVSTSTPSPLLDVVASRSTSSEVNTLQSIWIVSGINNPGDLLQPGSKYFDATINSSSKLLWLFYWCASDQSTLNQNLAHTSVTLFIDNTPLAYSQIFVDEDRTSNGKWYCRNWYTTLSKWVNDANVRLTIHYVFSKKINDGYTDYPAGDYYIHLNVTTR
jgi:hypothetical protein